MIKKCALYTGKYGIPYHAISCLYVLYCTNYYQYHTIYHTMPYCFPCTVLYHIIPYHVTPYCILCTVLIHTILDTLHVCTALCIIPYHTILYFASEPELQHVMIKQNKPWLLFQHVQSVTINQCMCMHAKTSEQLYFSVTLCQSEN